ncbi:hypothetical protein CHUAL_003386 [Chamberlinius hualienensis]
MGFIKKKNNTVNEYFMASNELSIFKMTCSTFSTIISSGLIVGLPAETYYYGMYPLLGFALFPFFHYFNMKIFFPVYYKIGSPDLFAYYELRFYKNIRFLLALLTVIDETLVMSIVFYSVGITLSKVTGINAILLTAILVGVCVVYSSLGGVRGVSVADTIQCFVILASLFAILTFGVINVGGLRFIWDKSWESGRLSIFNLEFSLTTRNTFWSFTIGRMFEFIALVATNPIIIMRMMASRSTNDSLRSAIYGSLIASPTNALLSCLGIIIYAKYYLCDPILSGSAKTANQLLSVFIGKELSIYSGLAGTFFAGLICAAVSTASSILNGSAALTMETFIKPLNVAQNEKKYIVLSKLTAVAQGLLAFVGIFLIERFPNLYQATTVLKAIRIGPQFGLLFIGMFFPAANKKCAVGAFGTSLVFMLWIIIGSLIYPIRYQTLPTSIEGCQTSLLNTTNFETIFSTTTNNSAHNVSVFLNASTQFPLDNPSNNLSAFFPLSSISFAWYHTLSILFTLILFGLLTIIFGGDKSKVVNYDLIPDVLQRFHKRLSPKWRRWLLCNVYPDEYVLTLKDPDTNAVENESLMDSNHKNSS